MNIIKSSLIVDFCIQEKIYERYKRPINKRKYVERVLRGYLHDLVGKNHEGIEIRYCDIESNTFWEGDLCFINDLGYNYKKQLPERIDGKKVVRVFGVDLIGVVNGELKSPNDIKEDNFIASFSSILII